MTKNEELPVVTEALEPCPFCGGSDIRGGAIRDGWMISCRCGASGAPAHNGPLTMPHAVERAKAAWNTRHRTRHEDALKAELATGALLVRSLMRQLQIDDHLTRRPDLVDGKAQYASARAFLSRIDSLLADKEQG